MLTVVVSAAALSSVLTHTHHQYKTVGVLTIGFNSVACGSAGSVVVELGCGSAQKTSILLNQLLCPRWPGAGKRWSPCCTLHPSGAL